MSASVSPRHPLDDLTLFDRRTPNVKKSAIVALAVIAVAAILAVGATTASAFPTKTKACTVCHARSTAVKVAVTKVSATATVVTYRVKVTGGSGATGWAVLFGSKNLAHKTASTGTFKVAKGRAIKVWAVKFGSGSNYKALTAK
jgi:hypothetical protein